MTAAGNLDPERIASLKRREDAAFFAARPRSAELWARSKRSMPNGVPMSWLRTSYDHPPLFVAEGKGARFHDVDGHEYSDFNVADMSMFTGYAPEPVVEAVSRRVAGGAQFMLPNEDAAWVAEELGRRYGLPKWQFTLSATHANTEAIRISRAATGRDKVLFFDGKYHGHFDEALVDLQDGKLVPEEGGLPRDVTSKTKIVQFNDADALRSALEPRDVAIVITEPTITNNVGLVLPEPGFHDALRAITRETGTVLLLDETHTHVVGPGGSRGCGRSSPTWSRSGSRSPRGSPWAPTA
jgi:glutamate-1-semialdehyde 2,1-aminomutase